MDSRKEEVSRAMGFHPGDARAAPAARRRPLTSGVAVRVPGVRLHPAGFGGPGSGLDGNDAGGLSSDLERRTPQDAGRVPGAGTWLPGASRSQGLRLRRSRFSPSRGRAGGHGCVRRLPSVCPRTEEARPAESSEPSCLSWSHNGRSSTDRTQQLAAPPRTARRLRVAGRVPVAMDRRQGGCALRETGAGQDTLRRNCPRRHRCSWRASRREPPRRAERTMGPPAHLVEGVGTVGWRAGAFPACAAAGRACVGKGAVGVSEEVNRCTSRMGACFTRLDPGAR